ncbi:hypothetical protein GGS23DRAFT_570231 [Durotheca rogersii]|uniref:uncharacterized protein n=1 Tax=Durotheca rogersii TaxID=419775 RepID=UPI0022208A7E|nr:uncharacterized protein GGS23DRAFT_570231 [Durotheca rogersii]KAI5862939.1 hypothetical protein GGS23DRAFT_570231 [Durotheca rogersii]
MAAQDPNAPTDSNGGALVATAVTMLAFSWLSVALRSFVRARLTNGFQWDDWFMLAAQVNFTISCVFILEGVSTGLGRHNKSLDQQDEIKALMYQALATATYILNMWLVKLSIAIFLVRLSSQNRYKYTIYGSITVVSIWSIVLFFWNLFQCNPVPAQWDYTILQQDPNARCVSADEIVNAAYALSVMNVLSDWLYALIPIPMLWKVKMTAQAKLTVVIVLGLGVFASIATLVRLKFLSDLTELEDILHNGTDAMVWTLIEPGVAIVASSLVTIRPLLRLWKIKGFGTTGYSRSAGPFGNSQPISRTTRSNKMPAFGSAEVTLVDVELGQSKGSKSGGKLHRSLSLSDATTVGSSRSRSSSDAPLVAGRLQRSRSISDAETLTSKSHRSRPSHMSMVFEAPLEEDDGALRPPEHEDPSGSRRQEVKSEMYIIEGAGPPTPPPTTHKGPVRNDTWLSEQGSSSDESFEITQVTSRFNDADDSPRFGKPLPLLPPSYQR